MMCFVFVFAETATLRQRSFSDCRPKPLPQCTLGKQRDSTSGLSGYYYNNTWKSLKCKTLMYQYRKKSILQCLYNKTVYFLGDSTVRQWFTFIIEKFEQHKVPYSVQNSMDYKVGLDTWKSTRHNVTMFYHHQGLPIQTTSIPTRDIHYIASMLESIPSHGADTIFFICVGAHFTINTLEFYRTRLKSIKNVISRLHSDSPVIVKSLNTRLPVYWQNSNWYHEEANAVLGEEFSDVPNAAVVDVWNMTTAHEPWQVHPINDILENEIAVAFSYLCPKLFLDVKNSNKQKQAEVKKRKYKNG